MNLGKHYMALAVNDIVTSRDFYQKLGFTADPNCGGVEQRWVMMNNGDVMIGLYQGMFPKNTLTFNPDDARSIHRELEAQGVSIHMASGIENESGPCHFLVIDPDDNPILVDQHF